MKSIRSLTLLLAAGALLVPAWSADAENAVRLGMSGHLIDPLDLGDPGFTGTLAAARLPHDAAFQTLSISNQALFAGPISLPANQPITLAGGDIAGSILTIGAGGIFAPQALPAGQSIRRNAANTAFESYAPNTGDGSALTNLNASALGTGTVSPARLGTGTPSSTTVLRGDGSWAGTTPTGNTVASTGSLLMGDGTGNAMAIPDGANLLSVLKTRLETSRATTVPVTNLLAGLTPNQGTINADGTITVPANDRVYWQSIPNARGGSTPTTYYGYLVALGEAAPGALNLHVGVGYDLPSADATVAPGVYRSVTTTTADGFALIINNTTAAPITIYFPVVGAADGGLSLVTSAADATAVASPPVADLDFTRFSSADRSARYLAEKQTTLAADSVHGNDASTGTLYAPKATLPQSATNGSEFGLYRGSVFRDSLPLSSLGTTHGIAVQDVALGSRQPLPIISGLVPAANGAFTSNGDGSYSFLWTPAEAIVNDGYSNVYAVEINTQTEAATPIASRRRMVDVNTRSAVAATPGSVLIERAGSQWQATIRPSDSVAPGSGRYRYEVVARVQPANWGSFDANSGDGLMSGLQLVGGSSGYGSLGAPPHFVGDRLVLVHATTHTAVIGGGSLQRSLFYEAGNLAQSIQLAWYAGQGAGLCWETRRCLFYANVGDRPANGLIAHTGGSPFERGDLSDTAFLGARWSDGSLHGTAIDYVNVAAGTIERVYVQGIASPLGVNLPLTAEISHNVFRQVHAGTVSGNFHDNIVLAESGGDPASSANQPLACFFQQSGASATNNLFWARSVPGLSVGYGDQVNGITFYGASSLANCTCQRNIIVLNPVSPTTASSYFSLGSATLAGMSVDYNLVINLAKGGFNASQPGTNYPSWASYRAGLSLDAHSLYIDLSADPRGLQAVFADPLNGDFRWAQTEVARRCAAYCQANHVGPGTVTSRWPTVPTVDEAARLLTGL